MTKTDVLKGYEKYKKRYAEEQSEIQHKEDSKRIFILCIVIICLILLMFVFFYKIFIRVDGHLYLTYQTAKNNSLPTDKLTGYYMFNTSLYSIYSVSIYDINRTIFCDHQGRVDCPEDLSMCYGRCVCFIQNTYCMVKAK